MLEAFIESLPIPTTNRKVAAVAAESAAVDRLTTLQAEAHPSGVAEDAAAAATEEEPEDKSVTRMKSAISSMVSKLKVKIDTTEKILGDKLKVLDKDGDGEISFDEVKAVVGTVMKKGASTEESVEQLFGLLDSNKDGKVSVAELLHYIHKKKESMEAEVLEVGR